MFEGKPIYVFIVMHDIGSIIEVLWEYYVWSLKDMIIIAYNSIIIKEVYSTIIFASSLASFIIYDPGNLH